MTSTEPTRRNDIASIPETALRGATAGFAVPGRLQARRAAGAVSDQAVLPGIQLRLCFGAPPKAAVPGWSSYQVAGRLLTLALPPSWGRGAAVSRRGIQCVQQAHQGAGERLCVREISIAEGVLRQDRSHSAPDLPEAGSRRRDPNTYGETPGWNGVRADRRTDQESILTPVSIVGRELQHLSQGRRLRRRVSGPSSQERCRSSCVPEVCSVGSVPSLVMRLGEATERCAKSPSATPVRLATERAIRRRPQPRAQPVAVKGRPSTTARPAQESLIFVNVSLLPARFHA